MYTIQRPHFDCSGRGCRRCQGGFTTLQRSEAHRACDDYAESLEVQVKMLREELEQLVAVRQQDLAKLEMEKRHIRDLQAELRQVRNASQELLAAAVFSFSAAKN